MARKMMLDETGMLVSAEVVTIDFVVNDELIEHLKEKVLSGDNLASYILDAIESDRACDGGLEGLCEDELEDDEW